MDRIEYSLQYLLLFEQDLAAVRHYIECILQNPHAALQLIEDTERAIYKRLANPISFEPVRSTRNRKHPYYSIYIRNYMVLYVVIDNVMEVRRFVYSKRDLTKLI